MFKWYSNVPWYIVNWSFFLFLLATAVNCGILCFCVSESVWEPPEEFVSLAEQEGYVEQPADSTQQVSHQEFWEREGVCVCERERERKSVCVCVCVCVLVTYSQLCLNQCRSLSQYSTLCVCIVQHFELKGSPLLLLWSLMQSDGCTPSHLPSWGDPVQ